MPVSNCLCAARPRGQAARGTLLPKLFSRRAHRNTCLPCTSDSGLYVTLNVALCLDELFLTLYVQLCVRAAQSRFTVKTGGTHRILGSLSALPKHSKSHCARTHKQLLIEQLKTTNDQLGQKLQKLYMSMRKKDIQKEEKE